MLSEFDPQHVATLSPDSATPAEFDSTDEQLMSRILDHDKTALAELMHRHQPLLRTVISRIVHTDADVDDALQDVFLEVWNRAHLYDPAKGKALGWVITMARRRAIDRVRRRQAYDRAEERMRLTAERDPSQSTECNVETDANIADCAAMLRQALESLPAAQRDAVELAYYHGLSQREIAAQTGVPLGTIKTRLELGVRKIRAAVLAAGGRDEWSLAAA